MSLDLDLDASQSAWVEALKSFAAANEADDRFAKYRDDPVRFGHEVLGATYWAAQEAILDGLVKHHHVTVRGCRGWGKTHVGAHAVLWFGSTRRARILTMGPTFAQQAEQLWARINAEKATSREPIPGVCNTLSWRIQPDWYAIGRSTDDPDNIRGFHAGVDPLEEIRKLTGAPRTDPPVDLFILFDEALGIAQPIYEAIHGSLSGGNVYTLKMANPHCAADEPHEFARSHQPGSGEHRIWVSAEPAENDEVGADVHFDRVPEWLIKPEWIAKMRKDHGGAEAHKSPIYLADVRGQFSSASVDWQIIPRSILDASESLELPDDGRPESRHIGVDIAREGGDRNVAALWIGGVLAAVHEWRTRNDPSSLMTTAGIVTQLLKKWGPAGREIPARNVHIDVGMGAGVIDRMRQCGYYVDGVDFGSGPKYQHKRLTGQTLFQNFKSELFWVLRRALEEGEASIPEKYQEVRQQLQWHRYKLVERGGGTLIGMRDSKPDIVKQHGESPDFADAAVIGWSRGVLASGPGFRVM